MAAASPLLDAAVQLEVGAREEPERKLGESSAVGQEAGTFTVRPGA